MACKRRLIRVGETLPTWTATAILPPARISLSRVSRSRSYDDGMREEALVGALARVSSSLLGARVRRVRYASCVCVRVRIIRVGWRAIAARIDRAAGAPAEPERPFRTTHDARRGTREATQDCSRVPRQKTRKTRIVGESSRRFRVTACTASTVRPWSCALTTALPGVLTDSARLGSARHTVRRSAAQTRRGERCGGGACPLQTTPYD